MLKATIIAKAITKKRRQHRGGEGIGEGTRGELKGKERGAGAETDLCRPGVGFHELPWECQLVYFGALLTLASSLYDRSKELPDLE